MDDSQSNPPSKSVSLTLAPSHILQDGSFGHIPDLTVADRIRIFEQTVARHGLLDQDLQHGKQDDDDNADENQEKDDDKTSNEKDKSAEPKIHPLALASARLQSNGLNELNRAINLHTLVSTTDYFGLTNIIDPTTTADATTGPSAATSNSTLTPAAALYRLSRHNRILRSTQFRTCRRRSQAALAISSDDRCRRLRSSYRFVSPDHPTHHHTAAKATETVAVDLHVYQSNAPLGRLARGVPRYAVIALDAVPPEDRRGLVQAWKERHGLATLLSGGKGGEKGKQVEDAMDTEDAKTEIENPPTKPAPTIRTKAVPYVVADPSLGKINTEFDPSTVNMLTLQFDILKLSNGFRQSACLEPIGTGADESAAPDERVLVSLQHSLFCAKLFESMRRELAPDTETIGALRIGLQQQQQAVWLSGESDEHFLPPPQQMIGSDVPGLAAMCVVHVHEGDIQVLLDAEYSLRVRLVEPQNRDAEVSPKNGETANESGSQSPQQLLTLCRALLWHSQQLYHDHSKAASSAEDKDALSVSATKKSGGVVQDGHARRAASSEESNGNRDAPHILQRCVSLFSKIVLERHVRAVLRKFAAEHSKLQIQWMAVSVWDFTSHCTLQANGCTLDIRIATDTITAVTNDQRKATFRSAWELELCIKNWLRRASRTWNE